MKKAFTIIELLIVIFIFSSVMIMASSSFAMSYIGGRTHSSSSMEANRSLTLVLDIIGQKMANASGKTTITGVTYYGFHTGTGLLTIVLSDDTTCAYIGLVGTTVKMLQRDCSSGFPAQSDLTEQISSPDIKITSFTFTPKNEWNPDPAVKTAPYITVKITGTDTKTGGKSTLETTYSIPAYTYNKW